jgi:hypothetical protein
LLSNPKGLICIVCPVLAKTAKKPNKMWLFLN